MPEPTQPAEFYKVLGPNRTAHLGTGTWPQCKRWTPEVADPVLCRRGWHLARPEHLIEFLGYGQHIYTAEPHPEATVIDGDTKVVCSKARLLAETLWSPERARLFAADCAEHVLHLYEARHPGDSRVRDCIAVSRRFALGLATRSDLAAAEDAAGDAAWAARDAAWAAAWAARDAAWAAQREWQNDRLLAYLHEPDLSVLLVSQEVAADA